MKEAKCAGCGADVTFRSPGSLVVVCEFCQTASYRTDVALEDIGKVAQRATLASHFQFGTTGTYKGQPFIVLGQIQLDHGLGLWNEWIAEIGHGDWIWIAEAQGEIIVFRDKGTAGEDFARPAGLAFTVPTLSVGSWVMLEVDGAPERFMVTEAGSGTVVTIAGELPFRIKVGETTHYVDLRQGERGFATLDYTRGRLPEMLIGERVDLAALALDEYSKPEYRPDRIKAKALECANCGASLSLRDPEKAMRLSCENCLAVLSPTGDATKVVSIQKARLGTPALPLGLKGTLRGLEVEVLAFLVRSVTSGGVNYPWREYLLRTKDGGYRWLIESDGHFLFGEPVSPDAVITSGGRIRHGKDTLKPFTSGAPVVDFVLGECYWDVKVGETSQGSDYIKPPFMVSVESTPTELHATVASHLSHRELADAFDFRGALPAMRGVGAVQPNPYSNLAMWWILFAIFVGALIATRIYAGVVLDNAPVLSGEFGPVPATEQATNAQFTEEFDLPKDGNLEINLLGETLIQGWIGVGGSLVNVETGDVTNFSVEAQYYSGVDGGESWSEGDRRGQTTIGSVKKGRYMIRFDPIGAGNGLNSKYKIEIKRCVPTTWPLFLAIPLLLIVPILVTVLNRSFEGRRWKNSDHPWGE